MPAIVIEYIPTLPVRPTIAFVAHWTKERHELEINSVQCARVPRADLPAEYLEGRCSDGGGEATREADSHDLSG
jgi:hypothetical protein